MSEQQPQHQISALESIATRPECPTQARHLVLVQHGILSQGFTWPEKFEAHQANRRAGLHVITDHYEAGPFPRVNMLLKNPRLGREQAETIAHWVRTGDVKTEVSLVAHSNGCDIARHTALHLAMQGIFVRQLILIAAPLPRDLGDMGLRQFADNGYFDRISVWFSPNDSVLHRPGQWLGLRRWLQWPYGNLGRTGARDVKYGLTGYEATPVTSFTRHYNRAFNWGHNEYFAPENIERTFDTIIEEITTP